MIQFPAMLLDHVFILCESGASSLEAASRLAGGVAPAFAVDAARGALSGEGCADLTDGAGHLEGLLGPAGELNGPPRQVAEHI